MSQTTTASRTRLIKELRLQQALKEKKLVQACSVDPWLWLTKHTKTFDEQAREKGVEAYKPFPADKPYLKLLIAILIVGRHAVNAAEAIYKRGGSDWEIADAAYAIAIDSIKHPGKYKYESHIAMPKSREMMASWAVIGMLTHDAQFNLRTRWVIQTKKEQTAEELVGYGKCLYAQQDDFLKQAFPLADGKFDTDSGKQAKLVHLWQHKSRIIGLPQGADQIRQNHPTGIFFDESCYIEDYEAALGAATQACRRIISISSAKPGNKFAEICAQ